MAIPNGTKFHGVAPDVPTDNLGSATMNAKRNVYTYPDDFDAGARQYTYTGIITNLGAGTTPPISGGDTVEWAGIQSPTTQTSVLVFPEDVLVTSVYFKAASVMSTLSADFDYVFNLYTSGSLGDNDPTDPADWTQVGALVNSLDVSAQGIAPGFIEDVTSQGFVIPAGDMFIISGIELAGSVSPNTLDATVGIVLRSNS